MVIIICILDGIWDLCCWTADKKRGCLDRLWKICRGYVYRDSCIFRANINYWPFLYPEVIGCKKESIFMSTKENLIIKFDFYSEQTVGKSTKIIGLTKARYLIPIIDGLNLEANPRSAKTGAVTDAIQESIERDVENFPFKTKESYWPPRSMSGWKEAVFV